MLAGQPLTVVRPAFRPVVATARVRLGGARNHELLVRDAQALLAVLDREVGGLPRRMSRAPRSTLRSDGSLLGHPGDLIGGQRAPIGLVRGLQRDLGQALRELRGSRRVAPLRQQLARGWLFVVHVPKDGGLNVGRWSASHRGALQTCEL